jgi:homocitrate synthase
MCPHATNETKNENEEMVAIDMSGSTAVNGVNSDAPNGSANLNGRTIKGEHTNGHAVKPQADRQRHNPYAPRASDFLNNISNFSIIESTLRGPSPP